MKLGTNVHWTKDIYLRPRDILSLTFFDHFLTFLTPPNCSELRYSGAVKSILLMTLLDQFQLVLVNAPSNLELVSLALAFLIVTRRKESGHRASGTNSLRMLKLPELAQNEWEVTSNGDYLPFRCLN